MAASISATPEQGPGGMPQLPPTLLVIEDTPDDALLVGTAAERARPGLEVRIAKDGRDGIAYIEGLPPFADRRLHPVPDLIILDLRMPELDGFEVLKYLQDRRDPRRPPVVVLTSSNEAEDERMSLELGASAYYTKPTDVRELGEVVREIVDQWIGTSRMLEAHIWMAG